MASLLSIITPSYNKHEYVQATINSVLNQSFTDYDYWLIDNSTDQLTRPLVKAKAQTDARIKYLEIDFTPTERTTVYIPAYIFNQVIAEIDTKYIFYLSDDDLVYPSCLAQVIDFMESDPTKYFVCYFTLDRLYWRDGEWLKDSSITVSGRFGKGTTHPSVDCKLDGGQIIFRTDCLKSLSYPFAPENLRDASHSDGLFMDRLAKHYTFYPLPTNQALIGHRLTPKSTWTRP